MRCHRSTRCIMGFLLATSVSFPSAAQDRVARTGVAKPGDRKPDISLRLPAKAFRSQGGKVFDLVKDFGAIPNDGKDDTAAFRKAYDQILKMVEPAPGTPFIPYDPGGELASPVIYIPDGVYDVSDTAIYSSERIHVWGFGTDARGTRVRAMQRLLPSERITPGSQEMLAKVRLIGQSRDRTVIRLADHAPGFDKSTAPKPVIAFGKTRINNSVAYNELSNLTVEIGAGNPGAIGVFFGGANNSGIHNVAVRASDRAAVGIHIGMNPSIPLLTDIRIDGFDVGIWGEQIGSLPSQLILDRVTLVGQREVGLRIDGLSTSAARLRVEGSPIPVEVREPDANVVLIDSDLLPSGSKSPPINLRDGFILTRNVAGRPGQALFGGAGNVRVTTNRADEFMAQVGAPATAIVTHAKQVRPATLDLPYRDPPLFPDDMTAAADPDTEWAAPEDFDPRAGTPGYDSTAAIQRAFASGKPVIYFPKAAYWVSKTIDIPKTVRSIQFLYGRFVATDNHSGEFYFRLNERSDDPLYVKQYQGGRTALRFIEQTAWRPLILKQVGAQSSIYANLVTGPKPVPLYLESANGIGKDLQALANTSIYARAINTESKKTPDFVVPANTSLWVLGFKSEGTVPVFQVEPGGTLEVLGGIANQFGYHSSPSHLEYGDCPDPKKMIACFPLIRNRGGRVSISLASTRTGPAAYIPTIIEENSKSGVRSVPRSALPSRPGQPDGSPDFKDFRIPLYVSDPG